MPNLFQESGHEIQIPLPTCNVRLLEGWKREAGPARTPLVRNWKDPFASAGDLAGIFDHHNLSPTPLFPDGLVFDD